MKNNRCGGGDDNTEVGRAKSFLKDRRLCVDSVELRVELRK